MLAGVDGKAVGVVEASDLAEDLVKRIEFAAGTNDCVVQRVLVEQHKGVGAHIVWRRARGDESMGYMSNRRL